MKKLLALLILTFIGIASSKELQAGLGKFEYFPYYGNGFRTNTYVIVDKSNEMVSNTYFNIDCNNRKVYDYYCVVTIDGKHDINLSILHTSMANTMNNGLKHFTEGSYYSAICRDIE